MYFYFKRYCVFIADIVKKDLFKIIEINATKNIDEIFENRFEE